MEASAVHILVGTLSYSGKLRACFAEGEDRAHLLVGTLDGVLRRLGGTVRRWRVDRRGERSPIRRPPHSASDGASSWRWS